MHTFLVTHAASSPQTGLTAARNPRPLAFHFALSVAENAAGSRYSSSTSASPSPLESTAMSVAVYELDESAPKELNSGVGFLGADGLEKLNGRVDDEGCCEEDEKEKGEPEGCDPNADMLVWDMQVDARLLGMQRVTSGE